MREIQTFDQNFAWQSGYIPKVRSIIGARFVEEAAPVLDKHYATDLQVLRMGPIAIALRLRRAEYLLRYPDEVTVTWEHDDGRRCEGPKITVDGLCDWFFYAFVDNDNPKAGQIVRWRLLRLDPIREFLLSRRNYLQPNKGKVGDRSWFASYHVDKIFDACGPDAFVDFHPRWPGDLSPRPKKLEAQTTFGEERAYDPVQYPASENHLTILRGLALDPAWGDRADEIREKVEQRLSLPISAYDAELFADRMRAEMHDSDEEPR